MNLQDTVLELFEEKKIDKTIAYRLLSAVKKGAAAAQPAAPAAHWPQRLRQVLQLRADPAWRLLLVLYQLHLAGGRERVALTLQQATGSRVLALGFSDKATPGALLAALREQLAQPPLAEDPAHASPYVWIDEGQRDDGARQVAIEVMPQPGMPPASLLLQFSLQEHAQGVTALEDWPDCLQHWDQVLHAGMDQPLALLDRLPPRHKHLIARYNATAAYLPPAHTLPTLLEPVLARHASAVAVQTSRGQLDYASYRAQAWRMAHTLRRLGVQRNDRVAVLMQRALAMPVALYAIISAGGAYVPLETDLPDERLAGLLQNDVGARVLVTDADTLLARRLPLAGTGITHIVCVDPWPRGRYGDLPVTDVGQMRAAPDTQPLPVNQGEDLCYVIYTSGSTGRPKGVMIHHAALVNTLIGMNNQFNVGPQDRLLCVSSYAFDLSVWDIFGGLLAGAGVVLASKAQTRDPQALWALMQATQPTVWDSAPTAMSQLLMPFNEGGLAPLASMRLVIMGGEPIQRGLVADVARAFPNSKLSNGGGATEGTIYSIQYYPVGRFEPHWKTIPYGRPLPNQRFHVLNEAMRPCAIGEQGMLWIGGLGVALGYLGDTARTQASFVQAPWSDDPAERIYRTGDLGIMRADGLIDLCGRADTQVKLRGYRVELGEIEAALDALDGVDQSAVLVLRDADQQQRLVAFCVSQRSDLGGDTLRQQLARTLPEYMLPGRFHLLRNPPVNASGKLDRRALESLALERDEAGAAPAAPSAEPRNQTEAQLAQALAHILRIERIGVEDDFFLMGGDSLLTLQYLSVLGKHGFAATPQDIQQGRSIRGVLARVAQLTQDAGAGEAASVGLTPMGRKFFERLPLVDRDHWQQLMVLGFDHLPERARLDRAMARVQAHHPLLRARWDGQALAVARAQDTEIAFVDLAGVPWPLRLGRINRLVEALRGQATLQSPTLGTALLVRCSARDTRLYWVLHHLVVDANCWRVLIDDLANAYRDGEVRLLRAGRVQDLVDTVQRHMPEALAAWQARAPWERMPIPRRGADGGTGLEREATTLNAMLTPQETQRMYAALRGETNLHLLLLTALSQALQQWAGRDQVAFDIISNGRSVDTALDFSRSVGWFATHNPFGVALAQDTGAALVAVREAWQRYQQDSPFFVAGCNEARARDLEPLASQRDQPLLYSFLGDFDSLDLPEGWNILGTHGRNRGPRNQRTHELDFEALVARGRLMVRLVYPASQIQRAQAARLLRQFRSALAALITHLENS